MRLNGIAHRLYFGHHRLVDGKATCGINNDGIVTIGLGMCHGIACDFHSIFIARVRVHIHTDAFTEHGELVYSCRSVNVTGNEQGVLVVFVAQELGNFTRVRGFTCTLKASHQYHEWIACGLEFRGSRTHQFGHSGVGDLDEELTRLDGCQGLLARAPSL